jgi:Rac GTPase-activating protein 1
VPAPSGTGGTPQRGGGQLVGYISDYTPSIGPMIPGLIVHCVTEIEARGLGEVGIYRVSGAEKDVKALKMRFLNSKTQSLNLSQVDVHVLCGCLKDFLRSLREPLIPTVLWQDFSNAAQACDSPERMNRALYDAIRKLPQPNRDTLAFLIQHFQRVAQCPEIKMPFANIAKVFGPTIVGYSSADPDQEKMMTETYIQALVMEGLLNVPTQYWSQFVDVGPSSSDEQQQQQQQSTNDATRYYTGKLGEDLLLI